MEQFFESSPKLLGATTRGKGFEQKYPWDKVPVGKSFVVPDHEFKLGSIRSYIVRMGHKFGRKFKVVHHAEDKIYEVGCVAEGLPVIEEKDRSKKKSKAQKDFPTSLPQGWGVDLNAPMIDKKPVWGQQTEE